MKNRLLEILKAPITEKLSKKIGQIEGGRSQFALVCACFKTRAAVVGSKQLMSAYYLLCFLSIACERFISIFFENGLCKSLSRVFRFLSQHFFFLKHHEFVSHKIPE